MRTFPVTISVHAVDSLEVGVRFWGERLGLIRQASHHRQRRSSREAALSPWTAYSTCQRLRPSNTSRANCCIDLYTKLTQSEHFPRCWTFSPAIIPLFPRAFFMAFVFPLKANGHHALASFVAALEEIPENRKQARPPHIAQSTQTKANQSFFEASTLPSITLKYGICYILTFLATTTLPFFNTIRFCLTIFSCIFQEQNMRFERQL